MLFVTVVYGRDYIHFLLPFLYSVHKQYPEISGMILWNELPERDIALLQAAFPSYHFINTNQNIPLNQDQRISSKLFLWEQALLLCPEGETICFLDCDTIIHKRFDHFLRQQFDVIYTWKKEHFALNTGVIIMKNTLSTQQFMHAWTQKVQHIINDTELLQEACSKNGAADQHALHILLSTNQFDKPIKILFGKRKLIFKGVLCTFLNETRSVELTDKTHIIHYKSGWHEILLHNKKFTQNRPKKESAPLLTFWNNHIFYARQFIATSITSRAVSSSLYQEKETVSTAIHSFYSICVLLDIDIILAFDCAQQNITVLAKYFDVRSLHGVDAQIISQLAPSLKDKKVAILMGKSTKSAFTLFTKLNDNPFIYVGAILDNKTNESMFHELIQKYFKSYTDIEDLWVTFPFSGTLLRKYHSRFIKQLMNFVKVIYEKIKQR